MIYPRSAAPTAHGDAPKYGSWHVGKYLARNPGQRLIIQLLRPQMVRRRTLVAPVPRETRATFHLTPEHVRRATDAGTPEPNVPQLVTK